MMKASLFKQLLMVPFACCGLLQAQGQGMHFSQYYNAPLLLNPANTALLSDNDFRLGVNYRNQWAGIVPYNTISAYGDCQLMRNMNYTNWMGLGVAFFNDKAGDGALSLTTLQANIAYHVMTSDYAMISAGVSVSTNQRSLNFNKLTFDEQWVGKDGVTFNTLAANGEQDGIAKTNFLDVGAGINYASFPNEFTYIKVGVGVSHLNQPKETFYAADTFSVATNKMGFRPTGNIDVLMRLNETFTINPSLYYTQQKKASEFVFGSLGMIYVGGERESGRSSQLIVGAFYRWNEAAVGAIGIQWGMTRLMASYDYTISSFSTENNGNGALEIALSTQGMYGSLSHGRRTMNCPRF